MVVVAEASVLHQMTHNVPGGLVERQVVRIGGQDAVPALLLHKLAVSSVPDSARWQGSVAAMQSVLLQARLHSQAWGRLDIRPGVSWTMAQCSLYDGG